MSELENKRERLQSLLGEKGLGGLLLHRVSSFAWATCGAASYVNSATSTGEATLLITPLDCHLIANNIEATRLEQEERLVEQGWKFHISPWYEAHEVVMKLVGKGHLGADIPYPGAIDLSAELAELRANLHPDEVKRFRKLGGLCAEAMDRAIHATQPGQSEHEIASKVAQEAQARGMQAIVNLIATDERIFHFRHPLPKDKKLDRYAMLVLCGRRWGLVCSITRFLHFGRLPDELRRKAEAVAGIDAAMIEATRPARNLGDVFRTTMEAYARAGYPEEWKLHHQGGPAGYEPREIVATERSAFKVKPGQVYAWNPSIRGTKSEDTILVGETENEVLTAIQGWPTLSVQGNEKTYQRPAILEVR